MVTQRENARGRRARGISVVYPSGTAANSRGPAGLSSKYLGEIERGEANVSIDLQQRLCVALDWYPFELSVSQQETLPEGPRRVERQPAEHFLSSHKPGGRTLQAMESEVARAGSPPKPKRGRPRTRHDRRESAATGRQWRRRDGHVTSAAGAKGTRSAWGSRRFNAFPARGKLAKFRFGCASEHGTWLTNVVGQT
jgi:hypothetical protein